MKKLNLLRPLLLSLLLTGSASLWAQMPSDYYDAAEGKSGTALKTALHNIIKGHKVVSYKGLLAAYGHTDVDANGKIWDIYSNYRFPLEGDCGQYHKEGDCWNREHSWPQSWFGSGTPKSDLFHVYPTDGYVNNRRSNYPYAEVSNVKYTSTNGSRLGTSITPGYSGTAFEPADEYKGDIARSYFYMSVRYYTEDGSWKSSAMVRKSEIEPWAMTMLLRWNDEDPVSQKEIDRHNAIYNIYQYNRNPFIDHPEYARMIWDASWTEGKTYAVTAATNLAHGSVSAPATAAEGSTVTITATPDAGYAVSSYSAWQTGNTAQTVSVGETGQFTMPAFPVTVSATFAEDNRLYDIVVSPSDHGTVSASVRQAKSGAQVTLSATPDAGYELRQWHVYRTGNMGVTVSVGDDGTFVMPAFGVTVGATFVQPGDYAYERVETTPSDLSGRYLIVYEDDELVFNGALEKLDAAGNNISLSVSDGHIAASNAAEAAEFTIEAIDGGYSLRSASGLYIGQTSNSNGLLTSAEEPFVNTISVTNGQADIVSGDSYLRFNTQNGQKRFRYYKSSTYTSQKAIQLYRRTGSETAAATCTITFHNGALTATQTVNAMESTALLPCPWTKEGFVFDGWSTEADGTGDYYADGATVTLLSHTDLYAQWDELFDVNCVQPAVGATISATPTEAVEGTPVTLSIRLQQGYELKEWTVTDDLGNDIYVENGEFDMPAGDVTVSASVVYKPTTGIWQYTPQSADDADAYHDLQGRRVSQLRQGIYIRGTKKVVR